MAARNWKNVAYSLLHKSVDADNDVEANGGKNKSEDQENDKEKETDNHTETLSMTSLTSDTSARNLQKSKNGNETRGSNEGSHLDESDCKINGTSAKNTQLSVDTKCPANKHYISSQIHLYARGGNVENCLNHLAKNPSDINKKGKHGMTPLHFASQSGHEQLVKELLKLGADKYTEDLDGLIPLHHAAHQGYLQCIAELLDGNTPDIQQLSAKSIKGRTPLMEAAESGCQDSCKLLIVSVVNETDNEGNTALHFAAKRGYSMIVKFLIENGADPKCPNKKGVTPVHEGARQSSKACLELLCESAQPDIFQTDDKDRHVIHFSVTQKSAECLKYLLEKDYIKNYIDSNGSKGTPLIHAMNCRAFICINALIDAGASLTIDHNGTYPIHKAAEIGYYEVCEKLLALNESILHQRNRINQTPLHMAAKSGNLDTMDIICRKIRDAQISPSYEDDRRQSALHISVRNKNSDEQVVRLLLRYNIASGRQDANGQCPLHIAAELGKLKCCEVLVERSHSNLHKTDNNGNFPLDLAFKDMEKNRKTIIYLLKEMCSDSPTRYLKDAKYLGNLMLLKCRMRKYTDKALSRDERDIVDAILQSNLWEDAFLGKRDLQPENFKKLVEVYPSLALNALGKCYKTQSNDEVHYMFPLYENTYYMKDGESPFNEKTGKVKKEALEHRSNVHEWAKSHPVMLMISNNECDLLKHPVTVAWLKHKWNSYIKYVHSALLFLDFLYLLALICFMATAWNWTQVSHANSFNISKEDFCAVASSLDQNETSVVNRFEERVKPYLGFYYWVTFSWVFKIIMEIFYCVRLRAIYIAHEMTSHVITQLSHLLFTAMLIFCPFGMCYQNSFGLLQEDWAWQCGIFAVLMTWLNLINAINQALSSEFLPIAKDLLEILLKVVYFLISFVAVFAFIFHLLLLEKKAFSSVHQSIASTIVWMLVDLGYTDTFVEEDLSYPVLSNIIFFLFITTIGCLILSLISKERVIKSRGKELDLSYRRLVIYTRLIFRYDVCFPWFRRWCAVSKYTDSHRNQTLLEYYLGEIENANTTEESTQNNEDKILERIKDLETLMSEVKDEMFSIKRHLKKMENGD